MLADDVDRSAPAGPLFGAGIEIEVLEIVVAADGAPIVHLGIVAGPEVRIEREERLTAARVPRVRGAEPDTEEETAKRHFGRWTWTDSRRGSSAVARS